MTASIAARRLMLLSGVALIPSAALAQAGATIAPGAGQTSSPNSAGQPGASTQPAQSAGQVQEQVEVATPGGTAPATGSTGQEIIVRGRNIPQPIRTTPQVLEVLTSAEIARTGDGDIASALGRVTGLSVVGNGFVYIRGLGDRYSLALLNGLTLPSPEPLRRSIPLDIFPTSVVSSAVVQKSYSVNYPGEFGGGVINLTTPSVPKEAFLNIGFGLGIDSVTTGKLGYTYYGSGLDYLGFDDGSRKVPSGIRNAIKSGRTLTLGNYSFGELQNITATLNNADTTLLQRKDNMPPNFSADLSFGKGWDIDWGRFGVFGSASFGNTWRTRDIRQQQANDPNLLSLQRDQKTIITEDRSVVSGLLGFGLDTGDHKIRFTNLYVRDTVKQGRLSVGYNANVNGAEPVPNPDFFNQTPLIQQNTYWFARQLIDTQLVGEFKFDDLSVNARGGYANSKRKSPYERSFQYQYNADVKDYVNRLDGNTFAEVAFSDLNEDAYAGSLELAYKLPTVRPISVSAGYNYAKNTRTSSRYVFRYTAPLGGSLPPDIAQQRPDYLTSDNNVYANGNFLGNNYNIVITDASGAAGTPAYSARLETHAGYGQLEGEVLDGVKATAGVRYEHGDESVVPLGLTTVTNIKKGYWLPAATVTWNFAENVQLRASGSKTIARPQFRELAAQVFQDFESDRQFQGNPFLINSRFTNAEARLEYYPRRGEIIAVDGFYKKIKNPIEQVAFLAGGGALRSGFANAPKADLYGAEAEATKMFSLNDRGGFFTDRAIRFSGNYTFTQSKLKVSNGTVIGPDQTPVPANVLFRDGAPLTGQSDHIANVQFGLESSDHLSQQTLIVNYASPRVTNRGVIQGTGRQPDIMEKPGVTLDVVLREESKFYTIPVEIKIEGRNLLGRKFKEYQKLGDIRVDINRFQLGRIISLSAVAKF